MGCQSLSFASSDVRVLFADPLETLFLVQLREWLVPLALSAVLSLEQGETDDRYRDLPRHRVLVGV
jgi:hypothetical protein